jgi:Ulp1 family protease
MVETAITVLGALGGFEFIKYLINRKTEKRKSDSEADNNDIVNIIQLTNHHDTRIKEKEEKIDSLYIRIRDYNAQVLDLTKQLNEKDLEIQLIKIQKCEVRGCKERKPPSGY